MAQECCSTALRNAKACGFEGQATAVPARAEEVSSPSPSPSSSFLSPSSSDYDSQVLRDPIRFGLMKPFQLISMTPPYEEVVYKELIDAVCNSPVLSSSARAIQK